MKILCLSNGHGEDVIAVRILQALQQHSASPEVAALPLVGKGQAYVNHQIPIVGPVKVMPSGGFVYMDGRQLARDLKGGLLQLTLSQLKTVKAWAKEGGKVLAVGDIVPLLFARWSGAPYAFVGTAKSEYYLRDEVGPLPRKSWFERLEAWSGSVYLPWERWLMSHSQCRAVFPRDTLTTERLKQWRIPAFDLGNPMMDSLEPSATAIAARSENLPLTIALIPGSRPPEAYANWHQMIQAVARTLDAFTNRNLLFVSAIAPSLDLDTLRQPLDAQGWRQTASSSNLPVADPDALVFSQRKARLILTQHAFNDCLHLADLAIAMAGTATEQFVGLGKPALTLPGQGPQFTPAFAEAQTRLLGSSVTCVAQPAHIPKAIEALLTNPDRLQIIADNGRRRMGTSGAAQRIADCLIEKLYGG